MNNAIDNYSRPSRRAMVLAVIAMFLFVVIVVGLTYWTSIGSVDKARIGEKRDGHIPLGSVRGAPEIPAPLQQPSGQ